MTYSSGDEPSDGGEDRLRGLLSTALWAAGSLGAFVAVIAWAYDLGTRDPSDVPAIRDAALAWKVAPSDPGGWRAPDQGSAVFGALGDARDPNDPNAVLGALPERPTEADLEAARRRASLTAEPPADARTAIDEAALAGVLRERADASDPNARRGAIDLDAQPPQGGGVDLAGLDGPPEIAPNVGRGAETPPAAAVTRLDQTPLAGRAADPAPIVGAGAEASAVELPPEAAPPAVETVDPAADAATPQAPQSAAPRALPEQTIRILETAAAAPVAGVAVQLAALDSETAVQARWSELQSREPGLLGARNLETQEVKVGDRRLYRLRATGFADRAEADRVCAELRAKQLDCFVTR